MHYTVRYMHYTYTTLRTLQRCTVHYKHYTIRTLRYVCYALHYTLHALYIRYTTYAMYYTVHYVNHTYTTLHAQHRCTIHYDTNTWARKVTIWSPFTHLEA